MIKNLFSDLYMLLTDSTYSVSVIGSILSCISLSWMGVIYSLRKSALVGEVIAHSAFPGLILGAFVGIYFGADEKWMSMLFILGAITTAYLSMKKLTFLQEKWHKSADSSLMISISAFLGVGVLLASIIQSVNPMVYKDVVIFLYGRTATMLYFHLVMYAIVMALLLIFIVTSHRRIQIFEFDKTFASFLGIGRLLDSFILMMTLVVVILGLRSCGILLLSGMMATPAIASRFWVRRMSSMFILSSIFAAISALIGGYLSLYLGGEGVILPTGPVITIVSASITFFSILVGVRGGVILRVVRRLSFAIRCHEENILKALYKKNEKMAFKEIMEFLQTGYLLFFFVLLRVRKKVKILYGSSLELKEAGRVSAERIIRLHRLWEVYLYEVGFAKSRIHVFAEEIEHVLTDEMEEMLLKRLGNPTHCPHKQKIPAKKEVSIEPV